MSPRNSDSDTDPDPDPDRAAKLLGFLVRRSAAWTAPTRRG